MQNIPSVILNNHNKYGMLPLLYLINDELNVLIDIVLSVDGVSVCVFVKVL